MAVENGKITDPDRHLFVDLDGTLIRTDLLFERIHVRWREILLTTASPGGFNNLKPTDSWNSSITVFE